MEERMVSVEVQDCVRRLARIDIPLRHNVTKSYEGYVAEGDAGFYQTEAAARLVAGPGKDVCHITIEPVRGLSWFMRLRIAIDESFMWFFSTYGTGRPVSAVVVTGLDMIFDAAARLVRSLAKVKGEPESSFADGLLVLLRGVVLTDMYITSPYAAGGALQEVRRKKRWGEAVYHVTFQPLDHGPYGEDNAFEINFEDDMQIID